MFAVGRVWDAERGSGAERDEAVDSVRVEVDDDDGGVGRA